MDLETRLVRHFIIIHILSKALVAAEIHFSGGGGAKPPKIPTKLSNFRQTPPFALEKTVFSPLLGQNFRKFVNFPWAAAPPPPPPHQDFRHWSKELVAKGFTPVVQCSDTRNL